MRLIPRRALWAPMLVALLATQCTVCARKPSEPLHVEVLTQVRGLSSLEIERQGSLPLERALVSAPGVRDIDSESTDGRSKIVLTLEPSADLFNVRREVLDKLPRAELPPEALPELGPPVRAPAVLK